MAQKSNGNIGKTRIHLEPPIEKGELGLIQTTLIDLKLNPQKVAGIDAFVIDIDDKNLEGGLIQLNSQQSQILFYIDFIQKSMFDCREQVAEFIVRANYGLPIGNFEMDYDDGFVRFKNSLDFSEIKLNRNLIENLYASALSNVQDFSAELIKVMLKEKSAADAINDAFNALG